MRNEELLEMQRLAGIVPEENEDLRTWADAHDPLREDLTTGARGWLMGVQKGLATWKGKLSKEGGAPKAMAALDNVGKALEQAIASMGESKPR